MKAIYLIPLALLLALLVVIGWAVVNSTQAATPQVALSAPTVVRAPDLFDAQILVTDTTNLGAFELDLNYDHTLAQVISVTFTTFLGQPTECNPSRARCVVARGPTEQPNGVTTVGADTNGAGSGARGNGVLATLRFKPTGKPGTLMLFISSAQLTDTTGNSTTPSVQGATIRVKAPQQIFLPFVLQ